jgi:hypothetical protein
MVIRGDLPLENIVQNGPEDLGSLVLLKLEIFLATTPCRSYGQNQRHRTLVLKKTGEIAETKYQIICSGQHENSFMLF